MIRSFLMVALFAIAATLSYAQPSLPSTFQAKTVQARQELTYLCAGEERGLWWCSFTATRKTVTRGRPWQQIS